MAGYQHYEVQAQRKNLQSFNVVCDTYNESLARAKTIVLSLRKTDELEDWRRLQVELETTEELLTAIMASPFSRSQPIDDKMIDSVTKFGNAVVSLAKENPDCCAFPELADRVKKFNEICDSFDY